MEEALVLGIDLGGTNTVFALVNKAGKIVWESVFPTTNYSDFQDLSADIFKACKNQQSVDFKQIQAIGIGAPNGNYYSGCIEFAPNLPWGDKIEVVNIMQGHFQLPSFITNDANAAAIGEKVFGHAQNMKEFGVITLGTGLGSGIVVHGKVLYGYRGFGGEFGHIVVENQGRFCGCGNEGCLETYVSATGIKNTAIELMATSKDASILRNEKYISGKTIQEAALKGDALALQCFEITAKYLGKALAVYSSIFDPEAIFLFGGLSLAGDLLLNPTRKYMEENLLAFHKGKIKLMQSALDNNTAAILGASALAWDELSS